MKYDFPNVGTTKVENGSRPIEGVSTSVVAFTGVSPRGTNGEYIMISSWSEYVQKAALGVASPFISDDDMSYAIYNFYQNGGGKAYYGCVKSLTTAAVKATATIGGIAFTAKYEKTWGNKVAVTIVKNADVTTAFDVTISNLDGSDIYETFNSLSSVTTDSNYYASIINGTSDVITVSAGGTLAVAPLTPLTGGTDGSALTDADIVAMLPKLDSISDVSLLVNCGETSDTVLKGYVDYCTNRGNVYCLLDAPNSATINTVITARKKLSGLGEIHYPWVTMADPITGVTKAVPPSGMIAGIYARTDANYGVHKAPAGEEAVLRGALGVTKALSDGERATLFSAGVNCIIPKANKGVLMYGVRSMGQKYVSDDRLDIYVVESIEQGTEWALFEMNDTHLWLRLKSSITAFLDTMYRRGAFKGVTAAEAYYVVCDSTTNTDADIDRGIVKTMYGFANKKPAEFVHHQLSKITASGN